MFFESIKLLDGKLQNLEYHLERMENTRNRFFGRSEPINPVEIFEKTASYLHGLFKVRVDYEQTIKNILIDPYQIKVHEKLMLIDIKNFEYPFKYSHRLYFEETLKLHPGVDDILFIKNGFPVDTTFCNIALLGQDGWVTPESHLLPGTKRKSLIDNGILKEREIRLENLTDYHKICFINAMRDFEKVYTFVRNDNEIILKKADGNVEI